MRSQIDDCFRRPAMLRQCIDRRKRCRECGTRFWITVGLLQNLAATRKPCFLPRRAGKNVVHTSECRVETLQGDFDLDGTKRKCQRIPQTFKPLVQALQRFFQMVWSCGCERLGALDIEVGLGLRRSADGLREIGGRGERFSTHSEHTRPGDKAVDVMRHCRQESVENLFRVTESTCGEKKPAPSQIDAGESGCERRRPIVIGTSGRPIAVQAVQFAALQIELGVRGSLLDLRVYRIDLFVKITVPE
jgi:hypothetical protein